VSGITTAVQVAANYDTMCALLASGSIQCWGKDDIGQRGDGLTTYDPGVLHSVVGITNATQISGGDDHFCARLSDGTAKCWGNNTDGQLGDGAGGGFYSITPLTVTGLTNISSIYVGKGSFTCAILSDTTVKCWGKNDSGRLGDGTNTTRLVPTTVPGLSGVTSLAMAAYHACALLSDGTVRCWGSNWENELGDGSGTDQWSPVNVAWFSNATSIAAATDQTCVILADTTTRCWGYGWGDQLGVGAATSGGNISDYTVANLPNATQISGGWNHICGIISGGTVRCWGGEGTGITYPTVTTAGGSIP
jgi:alpha-tubulin suppressor-like RCC1 family protein